uniref:Cathepsin L n=1 Tax=Ditylenchus dipsaci TaxID=166011 RepID=A0A915ES49_9BILA
MRFFVFCVVVAASYSHCFQVEAHRARNRQYNAQPSESLKQLIQQGYQDWEAYKGLHGKSFTDENEENERMLAFLAAQQHVRQHNEAYEKGDATFKLDVNNIADLPFSEYQKLNGYRRLYGDVMRRNSSLFLAPHNVNVPESMTGEIMATATGSLEGQHKRSKGVLVSLSEQNLVDCSAAYGNNGCNGGLMDFAFQYIKENHGVDTETSYPYKARQKKCHFVRSSVGAEDTGFMDLPEGMRNSCSEQLDHGVLVVGYGTDAEDGDYWIVKNRETTNRQA